MATHSCSCLENPRNGGAWWADVYGVAQNQTWLKRLSSSSSSLEKFFRVRVKLWCWERPKAEGEGDDSGQDGWMASSTQCIWVWVNSGSWRWTGRPGVLQFMGSHRVGHSLATQKQQQPWSTWHRPPMTPEFHSRTAWSQSLRFQVSWSSPLCIFKSLQTDETADSFPPSLCRTDWPLLSASGAGKPFCYVTVLTGVSKPTDGLDRKPRGAHGVGLFCDSWPWQPGGLEER